jgi:hypothetical protein
MATTRMNRAGTKTKTIGNRDRIFFHWPRDRIFVPLAGLDEDGEGEDEDGEGTQGPA